MLYHLGRCRQDRNDVVQPTTVRSLAAVSFRLVRYYRIAGFRSVREVGEDLGSFKDRLLWGAEGTLMVAEAADFMRRWTPLMVETSKSSSEDSAVPSIGDKQEV